MPGFGFQGSKTVTAAGTSEPLVASSAGTLAKWCACVTLQYTGANNIYGGFGTVAADVSSSSKAFTLNSTNQSVTIGDKASGQNDVDLSKIRIDTDTNGQGVTYFAEQI